MSSHPSASKVKMISGIRKNKATASCQILAKSRQLEPQIVSQNREFTIETATGGNVGSFGVADAMAVAAVDGPLGPQLNMKAGVK